MPHRHLRHLIFILICCLCAASVACQPGLNTAQDLHVPGDVERGRQLIADYGCHACHSVPGVPGAAALVGPPLDDWAGRHYIAGTLANTPENLRYWIQFPQDVEPGTAMPNLNVTELDAQDITAYLYTLGRDRWVNRQVVTSNAPGEQQP